MSETRPKKHKVEFIESYWTGGEFGSDYQWNDNHGELIRCKYCKKRETMYCPFYWRYKSTKYDDWFCADGKRKSADEELMDEMDADPLG